MQIRRYRKNDSNQKLRIFFLLTSIFFFYGCKRENILVPSFGKEPCLFSEKEADSINYELSEEDSFTFKYRDSIGLFSREEATLMGFLFLPYTYKEYYGKKSDSFYVVDLFYEGTLNSFENTYQLLKDIYIEDGWSFDDEVISSSYITATFKKVDKEMFVFIKEEHSFGKKNKKKASINENKDYILVHQSLLAF